MPASPDSPAAPPRDAEGLASRPRALHDFRPRQPMRPGRAVPRNPDIVVVGAGAAGLGATRRLLAAGYSVACLEARDRVGGRAHTDTGQLGVPWDLGCHWLHHAEVNPLIGYARQRGFDIYDVPGHHALFDQGAPADAAARQAFEATYESYVTALTRAGAAGQDVPASDVVPAQRPWSAYAGNILGSWTMGRDMDRVSCLDWYSYPDGTNKLCRQGYGAIVADLGADLPVRCNTPVTRISWDGPGVTVETADEAEIRARAAVVTVPTGVLAAEAIAFAPALPHAKAEAVQQISMGAYNNVALLYDREVLGVPPDTPVANRHAGGRVAGIWAHAGGWPLYYVITGGRFAAALEGAGEAAALAWARGEIAALAGNEADRHFVAGGAARWGADPWARGAWAAAEPGQVGQRQHLRTPLANRVFFAGEACHPSMWATCHGAFMAGEDAGEQAAAALTGRPVA